MTMSMNHPNTSNRRKVWSISKEIARRPEETKKEEMELKKRMATR
jgi:hypothetical protein